MSKKKSKKSKKDRRQSEILRAQAKGGIRGVYDAVVPDKDSAAQQPKKVSHRLHVKEIRTDLVKTVLFAVFVVIILVMLKKNYLELGLGVYK